MNLANAIAYAAEKHELQVDKSDRPYILHPIRVMFAVKDLGDFAMIAAILHDVIEDCDVDREDLIEEGLDGSIIDQIEAVSRKVDADKKPIETYREFIQRAKSFSEISRRIKLADVKDNLSRLDFLKDEKQRESMRTRYQKAIDVLEPRYKCPTCRCSPKLLPEKQECRCCTGTPTYDSEGF